MSLQLLTLHRPLNLGTSNITFEADNYNLWDMSPHPLKHKGFFKFPFPSAKIGAGH